MLVSDTRATLKPGGGISQLQASWISEKGRVLLLWKSDILNKVKIWKPKR